MCWRCLDVLWPPASAQLRLHQSRGEIEALAHVKMVHCIRSMDIRNEDDLRSGWCFIGENSSVFEDLAPKPQTLKHEVSAHEPSVAARPRGAAHLFASVPDEYF